MKKQIASLILTASALSTFAFNPVVENQDSKEHTFTIKSAWTTKTEILNGNSKMSVSSPNSLVTVKATGDTITIKKDQKYIIKNGKISRYSFMK